MKKSIVTALTIALKAYSSLENVFMCQRKEWYPFQQHYNFDLQKRDALVTINSTAWHLKEISTVAAAFILVLGACGTRALVMKTSHPLSPKQHTKYTTTVDNTHQGFRTISQ